MARKNIKLPEDLSLALRDDKDDEQSWPHYLEEQCLHGDEGLTDVSHDKLAEVIADRVAQHTTQDTEAVAREVSRQLDYAELATQVGEEVEGRMR